MHDIADYLKKFTDKVFTYKTVKPDIVFEINKKEYAIEVETGKLLKYNKKDLHNKIENLNKNYPKRWFFAVTNKNIAHKYKKLGKTYDKRWIVGAINRIVNEK